MIDGASIEIDADDEHYLTDFKFTIENLDGRFVARWREPKNGKAPRESILLHRLIMGISDNRVVKAMDGNYLNCHRSNLLVFARRDLQIGKKHRKRKSTIHGI